MLEFIKKRFLGAFSNSKISSTSKIREEGVTLQGEDPGTIPSDDNPNPLVSEKNE